MMSGIYTSMRRFCHGILRAPVVTGTVLLITAVGIGIAGGVFSVVNAAVFRSPVQERPETFFTVATNHPSNTLPLSHYRALLDAQSIEHLAAWSLPFFARVEEASDTRASSLFVSCNFFSVFDPSPPLHGRLFTPADCESEAAIAVISEGFWRSRLARDPDVIGRTLHYGGHVVEIVGISSHVYTGSVLPFVGLPALLIPYTVRPAPETAIAKWLSDFGTSYFAAGRLRAGFSRSAATVELQEIARRVDSEDAVAVSLTNGSRFGMGQVGVVTVALSLALPAVILVLTSVNVGILLLSRALKRRHEIAIRLAVGAKIDKLMGSLLLEHAVLTALGALVSLVLVYSVPGVLVGFGLPPVYAELARPDWGFFVVLSAMTLGAALCSGLAPALEALNVDLAQLLNGRTAILGKPHRSVRIRGAMIAICVFCSIVPLTAVAALIKADARLDDLGFNASDVAVVDVPVDSDRGARGPLIERLAAVPGVASVAHAEALPFLGDSRRVTVSSDRSTASVATVVVSPEYFDVFDIRILAGAPMDPGAGNTGLTPVVVSRAFVGRFLEDAPLGRTIVAERGTADRELWEVVGVVEDRAVGDLQSARAGSLFVYRLMAEPYFGRVVVRFDRRLAGRLSEIESIAREEVGASGPVSTVQDAIDGRYGQMYLIRRPILLLALLALMLVTVGVYGVISSSIDERRHEIAIRRILGATVGRLLGGVYRRWLPPVLAGLLGGVFVSWVGLTMIPAELLLDPWDSGPYVWSCAAVLSVAATAATLSALRAFVARDGLTAAVRADGT